MRKIFTTLLLLTFIGGFSQISKDSSWKKIIQPTAEKINDLVHTRLDVKFDYQKSWMYGKAWITLHPHFYPTDSLLLDAKGMAIEEICMVSGNKNIPLKYTYDSMQLNIMLNKVYKAGENYTLYIKYISKPNEYKALNNTMMPGEKGLYFINPTGEIKDKPIQIWTQGETEANSYWVPTIDKPNQKTTDEITMTVPAKYLTLSNGLLISQKKNADGTRTDTWKMDLPHAPYLLFMAVGEYAVIKDKYKNKEVSYYVEKEYAPLARKIFGLAPEMIAFFSRITGVDFPWPKYAQITGRDYIFGAMENTSATLHEEASQQDARQLVDGNYWESVIAHELFHQWFGDYVTTESWSNMTLNESFADYSETLWDEYKYGKEKGQATIYNDLRNYLSSPDNAELDLVRFKYNNAFDAFDAVGYQKGGCILNMLRNMVGDTAFFKSIQLYLTTNKFKSAEVHNLRLAFEEVTGMDLNWFFNQWYYNHGHPKIDISYLYDAVNKTASVFLKQSQNGNAFKLPLTIDVYEGNQKKRYHVWMNNASDTFSFPAASVPDLINVDGDKVLVWVKTDHKTAENFAYQYNKAGSYIDRREAIGFFLNSSGPAAMEFLNTALKDKNERLRRFTLDRLNLDKDSVKKALEQTIINLAKNDPEALVRAAAISALGKTKQSSYKPVFIKAIADSSYTVAGNALQALGMIDSISALNMAKSLSVKKVKGSLHTSIATIFGKYGDESTYQYIFQQFSAASLNEKFNFLEPLAEIIIRSASTEDVKKGVTMIAGYRDNLPSFQQPFRDPQINGILNKILIAKQASGSKEMESYIKSMLPSEMPQ